MLTSRHYTRPSLENWKMNWKRRLNTIQNWKMTTKTLRMRGEEICLLVILYLLSFLSVLWSVALSIFCACRLEGEYCNELNVRFVYCRFSVYHCEFFFFRDSVTAQLQLALAKADSEQLARSISDEQLLDVEKAKTMLELQMKDMMQRHKAELTKKDNLISTVSTINRHLYSYPIRSPT